MRTKNSALVIAAMSVLTMLNPGCETDLDIDGRDGSAPVDAYDNVDEAGLFDCSERDDTGYRQGNAFSITVVSVDSRPVERSTANAYIAMQEAASSSGVAIRIVSGFRTMSEQERLYSCYVNCNCNNCNLAARPGTSNHQSGHALDLNTSDGGVLNWLNNNGARFGFSRTVPSEAWHWEWWGNPADVPGPCGTDPRCDDVNFGGCDGSVLTRCDNGVVGSGDCGFFGATCSTDGGAPHCVHPICPANLSGDENGSFCRDDGTVIGTCDHGAYSEGDCGAFGAGCSERGANDRAHCVHPQCLIHLDGGEDGQFCTGATTLGTCTLGVFGEGDCAAFGGTCSDVGGGHCVHFSCWSNLDGAEDGSFCDASGNEVTCTLGVPVVGGPCAVDVVGDGEGEDVVGGEGEGEGEEGEGVVAGEGEGDDEEEEATAAADDLGPSVIADGGCGGCNGGGAGVPVVVALLALLRRRRGIVTVAGC